MEFTKSDLSSQNGKLFLINFLSNVFLLSPYLLCLEQISLFSFWNNIFFFSLRNLSVLSERKNRSLANKVSSIEWIKSSNFRYLVLCQQTGKTFLFHLFLLFPRSFDVDVPRISGEVRDIHCCHVMLLSHFSWKTIECISWIGWLTACFQRWLTFDLHLVSWQYLIGIFMIWL